MPRRKVADETKHIFFLARVLFGKGWRIALARLLGVHRTTVERWGRGEGRPSYRHIHWMLGELRMHIQDTMEAYNNTLVLLEKTPPPMPVLPQLLTGAAPDLAAFALEPAPKETHPTATAARNAKGHWLPTNGKGFGKFGPRKPKPFTVVPMQRRNLVARRSESV